ncbi:hypothetical protein WMY93_032614 [Mugilogobius chulae]|uniref:Uncharacterized protein n=1 Tax=Mugilogobius chulae TaxID=88201 RepID=A0AAW0MNH8_9GOBI
MAKYSKADEVEWSSGLCDCFADTKTCCYGFWCCPCLACTVSSRFQENICLPLCDIFSPAIMASCGIPCVPPALFGLRVAFRHRYKIKRQNCKREEREIVRGGMGKKEKERRGQRVSKRVCSRIKHLCVALKSAIIIKDETERDGGGGGRVRKRVEKTEKEERERQFMQRHLHFQLLHVVFLVSDAPRAPIQRQNPDQSERDQCGERAAGPNDDDESCSDDDESCSDDDESCADDDESGSSDDESNSSRNSISAGFQIPPRGEQGQMMHFRRQNMHLLSDNAEWPNPACLLKIVISDLQGHPAQSLFVCDTINVPGGYGEMPLSAIDQVCGGLGMLQSSPGLMGVQSSLWPSLVHRPAQDSSSSGCYGFWCCPCLACTVSGKFQENICLPLCDIFSPAILASCGIPCVPPALFGLRVALRHRYKIKVRERETQRKRDRVKETERDKETGREKERNRDRERERKKQRQGERKKEKRQGERRDKNRDKETGEKRQRERQEKEETETRDRERRNGERQKEIKKHRERKKETQRERDRRERERERNRDKEREKERNRDKERERNKETEKETERERQRNRDKETGDKETERERKKQRDRKRERKKQRETDRERERDRHTEREGDRVRERKRHKERERKRERCRKRKRVCKRGGDRCGRESQRECEQERGEKEKSEKRE